MCVNFKSLNNITYLDIFPLLYIANVLNLLGCATMFSSIDLA